MTRGDRWLIGLALLLSCVGLVMVFSQEVIQRVTALGRAIYAIGGGAEHGAMHALADKLERDAFIWTHLAGDSLSRIKTIKKVLR